MEMQNITKSFSPELIDLKREQEFATPLIIVEKVEKVESFLYVVYSFLYA